MNKNVTEKTLIIKRQRTSLTENKAHHLLSSFLNFRDFPSCTHMPGDALWCFLVQSLNFANMWPSDLHPKKLHSRLWTSLKQQKSISEEFWVLAISPICSTYAEIHEAEAPFYWRLTAVIHMSIIHLLKKKTDYFKDYLNWMAPSSLRNFESNTT